MQSNNICLEKLDVMKKTLAELSDEADKVISDRKKQTLVIELQLAECSIKIEIRRTTQSNDEIMCYEQLSENEKNSQNA